MKREILFRGKRVDNGKWVEGSLWDKCASGCTIISGDGTDKNCFAFVIPETIGQLVFKLNGHNFFDGDIIRNSSTCRYVILWNEENQCYSTFSVYDLEFINGKDELMRTYTLSNREALRLQFLDKHRFYPIGNIHDNPELIKQESNEP